jgi:hypothetical protein
LLVNGRYDFSGNIVVEPLFPGRVHLRVRRLVQHVIVHGNWRGKTDIDLAITVLENRARFDELEDGFLLLGFAFHFSDVCILLHNRIVSHIDRHEDHVPAHP